MAKRNKRLQKAAKRKAKVKTKKQVRRQIGGVPSVKAVSNWPILECLISDNWQDATSLCQLVVTRENKAMGLIGAGFYLVDLGCLGIKNAGFVVNTPHVYHTDFKPHLNLEQTLIPCSLDMVARVLDVAVDYGKELGFKPHKDFRKAKIMLTNADPHAVDIEIPTGKEGRPFYFGGPYDNYEAIKRTLDRTVGPGNYEYIIPLAAPFEGAVDPMDDDEWVGDESDDQSIIEGDWEIVDSAGPALE